MDYKSAFKLSKKRYAITSPGLEYKKLLSAIKLKDEESIRAIINNINKNQLSQTIRKLKLIENKNKYTKIAIAMLKDVRGY